MNDDSNLDFELRVAQSASADRYLKSDPDKKYKNNPFIHNVAFKVRATLEKIKDTDKVLVDQSGYGEPVKVVYAAEQHYDRTPFLKIYLNPNPDQDFLLNLTKGGLRLFVYLYQNKIEHNSDIVIFSVPDYCEETKFQYPNRVYEWLNDLIKNNVLRRSTNQSVFWLNPVVCFRGERRYAVNKNLKSKVKDDGEEEDNTTNGFEIPIRVRGRD